MLQEARTLIFPGFQGSSAGPGQLACRSLGLVEGKAGGKMSIRADGEKAAEWRLKTSVPLFKQFFGQRSNFWK
jgi:hypothetical protein